LAESLRSCITREKRSREFILPATFDVIRLVKGQIVASGILFGCVLA
jgi:hypothetical protein